MEIDSSSATRKRLREQEEEEEDVEQLQKRARLEIEQSREYNVLDREEDIIKEEIISNLLNFNADVFGGITSFLDIKDIVTLNRLNLRHWDHARRAVQYTETGTDIIYINNQLIPYPNPGKYQHILNLDYIPQYSTMQPRAKDYTVHQNLKRIWYMQPKNMPLSKPFDSLVASYNAGILKKMVNLERVELNAYTYFKSEVKDTRNIIILPRSVWWLYIDINYQPHTAQIEDFNRLVNEFISRIKTHVKYLRLAINYTHFNPVHLLSGKSSIKVLHIGNSNPHVIGPSGFDNTEEPTVTTPLEILLVGYAEHIVYPDLKVNTVIVTELRIPAEDFFFSARYNNMVTLYLGGLIGDDIADILTVHALLPENKTFPTLLHLILNVQTLRTEDDEEDADDEYKYVTEDLLMNQWLPQLTAQVIQFNHFPSLKIIELVLPDENDVNDLPIKYPMNEANGSYIFVYDEKTKPDSSFDIEREVERAVSKERDDGEDKEEESKEKPRWPRIGNKHHHHHRYNDTRGEGEQEEEANDENDPEHDFLSETTLGDTIVENGEQEYNSDEDFQVNYSGSYSPSKHRTHLAKTLKREQQGQQQKERLLKLNKAIKKERYERKVDSIIPSDPVPITSDNTCTEAMIYKRHFPAIRYGLFFCDDFVKHEDNIHESYYDCILIQDIYESGGTVPIARKGDYIDVIDIDTKHYTVRFVMYGKKYSIRMAFLLYDSQVVNKFPGKFLQQERNDEPVIRKPMSEWELESTGPKHKHDEDDNEGENNKKVKEDTVRVCDVEFPSVLVPTGDYSFDPERMATYLSKLPLKRRECAEVILRNTTYVDFTMFVSWLKTAIDDLGESLNKNEKFQVCTIGAHSSGLWIYLLFKYIAPPDVDDMVSGITTLAKNADPPNELIGHETVVLFDDASYSGLQIYMKVRKLPLLVAMKKQQRVNVHITVAALSLTAIVLILFRSVVSYINEDEMKNEQLYDMVYNHIHTVFEIEPDLNMDKRSTLFEDLVHRVVNVYKIKPKYPERVELAPFIKIYFHYGHIIDTLSNEIRRKPFITPFQYKQRMHDLALLRSIETIYENLHAYYFQHKLPDYISSYTALYQGMIQDTNGENVGRYTFIRGCEAESDTIGYFTGEMSSCPIPVYKQFDLQKLLDEDDELLIRKPMSAWELESTGPKHKHDDGEEEEEKHTKKAKQDTVRVCDVEFPSVLVPTGDYSFDPERVKEMLSLLEEKKEAAEVILRNTQYVDFVQFITWFKVAMDDFKDNFPDKKTDRVWLAFVIKLQSSGLWMTLLAMCINPSLKESCSGLFESRESQIYFDDKIRLEFIRANTYVIFDDCAYTGLQIRQSIKYLPLLTSKSVVDSPVDYVHIHIVCAVISLDAIYNIIKDTIETYLVSHLRIYKNELVREIGEYIKRYISMVFEKEPTLYMDKRTTLFEDIVSEIVPKYLPEHQKKFNIEHAKNIKLYFHYGHITDLINNEIERKPFLTPFQYNQRKHDLATIDNIHEYYGIKHAIYFQHKVPDDHSSYPHLYHGDYLGPWGTSFPIMRDCTGAEDNDKCPEPPYKKLSLFNEFKGWFKRFELTG